MIPPAYVQRLTRAHSTSLDRARVQLLVLESGLAFLNRARGALERGDVGGFVADIARTQDVVLEIAQTTDARGSSVAARLAALHQLIVRRLAHASAANSLELVDEILASYGPIVEAYGRVVHADA
jgi:flagellar biosynthetic protein FliS